MTSLSFLNLTSRVLNSAHKKIKDKIPAFSNILGVHSKLSPVTFHIANFLSLFFPGKEILGLHFGFKRKLLVHPVMVFPVPEKKLKFFF